MGPDDAGDAGGGQLNEWEPISPAKVIEIFAKKDAEHLVRDEVAASSFEHNYPDEGSFNAVWPPSSSSGLKMPFKAFRTRSNTMGVYQLQGMGNINRRGVGIRYKVVQTTNSKTAVAPSRAPAVVHLGINFGPTINRVIQSGETGTNLFLDLDTGRLLTPPEDICALFKEEYGQRVSWEKTSDPRAERMREWLRSSGANLMVSDGQLWLARLEMREGVAINPPWTGTGRVGFDQTDPNVVAKQAEVFLKPLQTNTVIPIRQLQPDFDAQSNTRLDTFLFRTREGTIGVLQILNTEDNPPGVRVRYKLVQEAGESVQSTGGEPHSITPLTASGFGLVIEQGGRLSLSGPPFGGPRSRTFILQHRLASEMADDLRQILLGRVGMEARPAPDNMQLTVTAPPDVLNRVSTFVTVADWPKRIVPGPDHEYPHADAEQAGRSFFYACSIVTSRESRGC